MDEKKHKLVIDGNAFYEVDLECQKKKEEMEKRKNAANTKRNVRRQRG